jgi:hypothetical protein
LWFAFVITDLIAWGSLVEKHTIVQPKATDKHLPCVFTLREFQGNLYIYPLLGHGPDKQSGILQVDAEMFLQAGLHGTPVS